MIGLEHTGGIYNGKMRDELFDREIFYSVKEAEILIEMWRKENNTISPHSPLGYKLSVPAAILSQIIKFQPVGLTLRLVQTRGQVIIYY